MTAQVISAHTIKMRFPEFASQDPAQIEFAIEEAAASIDSTWGSHQVLGMLYMTAHILMVWIARQASATGQEVASESFGGVLTVAYREATQPLKEDAEEDLGLTTYGLRVRDIMNRIKPAVAII